MSCALWGRERGCLGHVCGREGGLGGTRGATEDCGEELEGRKMREKHLPEMM